MTNTPFPQTNMKSKPGRASSSRSAILQFDEPRALMEARTRICDLYGEIELIEAQLSDPNRTDSRGKRLSGDEYKSWKRNARYALAAKKSEYQQLKLWVQKQREALETAFREQMQDGETMILALVEVIDHIFENYPDVAVSPADQAAIDAGRAIRLQLSDD